MMRFFFLSFIALTMQAQDYTLGVGVYPGDPKENFAPAMRIDSSTYRNLALHRPAYHSSSYDYNLTAQLVTDGIVTIGPCAGSPTITPTSGVGCALAAPKHTNTNQSESLILLRPARTEIHYSRKAAFTLAWSD